MHESPFIYHSNPLTALLRYLRSVAVRNLLGIASMMVFCVLSVSVPVYVKHAIDGLERGAVRSELLQACGMILVLAGSAGCMLFIARWMIIGASRKFEMTLRNDFMQHIQRLTPAFYHRTPTGDLMTRFSSDIEQVRLLAGPGIMYPAQTCLFTVLAFYAMMTLDVTLTLILMVPIAILMVYVNLNTRQLHKVYRQSQEIYSEMNARVQENFSGIRVIKAYCQETAESERFKSINDRYVRKNIEQIKLRGRLFPFLRFVGGIGTVLILWQGGLRVIHGQMTLGGLVQFAIYYQMLMWPIIALGWIVNVIHRGAASWRRIHTILCTPPEIADPPGIEEGEEVSGEIEVRDLTFAYEENSPPVLNGVSFRVEPGKTLAIVGPTGCGKTTLVNLLLHLYPVPPGTISIDGRDINDIPLATLRRSIAYVSQEVFLFSDTIRSNVLFGMEDQDRVSVDGVEAVSRLAQLDRDVDAMPERYETEIGERGITLSGGQKQRAGIARALILNRPILIFDDSLSSVDTDTEEAILRGLQETIHQRSAIIISHRISTVKDADLIIVLDEGKIVEEGTHDQLIEQEGLYARIHKRQLLEESLGIRS